jgi:hypothetical protein
MPLSSLKGYALRLSQAGCNGFSLQTKRADNTIPVPTFRPTAEDSVIALDVMPKGTPVQTQWGNAWLDVCNADNVRGDCQVIGLHAYDDRVQIESFGTGETEGKPIKIVINGIVAITINADGSVEIPNLVIEGA